MKKIYALFVLAIFLVLSSCGGSSAEYDEFAKCLTDSGVKMYGAYWCPHCLNQKYMFGDSWDYMNHIECSTQSKSMTQKCIDAGIESYPTWEFGDGTRFVGELDFEQLSQASGCSLPS